MALPGISVIFRRTNTAANNQDPSAFAAVVGYSSLGVRNQVMTLGSLAACAMAGNGEGIEQAAEIGLAAGWPVYFCPVEGTRQAPGAVTKVPASAGVPRAVYGSVPAYGSVLALGADHNGDLLYRALQSGVTIAHVVAGMSTPRSIAVVAKAITVNVATDGAGAVDTTETATSILASVLADSAAALLVTGAVAAGGTGASLVAALAVSAFDAGTVELRALAPGVSVRFVLPTTDSQALSVPVVVGGNVVVNLATDANKNSTSTAAQVVAAIVAQPSAAALVAASAPGAGTGRASALALVQLDDGSVTYRALTTAPTTIAHIVAGTGTTLSVPVVTGGHVIVNLATDSLGLPTSTAAQIVAAIAGTPSAAALVSAAAGGTGAGAGGAIAQTPLQFGSTSTLTASGTGVDSFTFKIVVLTPGTVGGTPAPSFQWSADGGITYSSKTLIPASGIVALLDQVLDTGVTVTFTGALEVDDEFDFTVAKPVVAAVDLEAGIDAAIADIGRQYGYLTSPSSVSRTVGTLINTKLQAVKTIRFLRGLFNVRAIGEGVPGETEAQWDNAVRAEWAGFVAADGPLWMAAGDCSHISGYTGRVYSRPIVVPVSGRRSASAVHQSLGETAQGPLPRIYYATDPVTGVTIDPGITHDERKLPGLSEDRFITTRTYAQRSDGEVFVTDWPTMADPSDAAHALGMYVNVLFEAARVAATAAFPLIEKPAAGIAVAESAQVPPGAISKADAARVESLVGGAVDTFLFTPKSDNSPSASPLAPDEKTITVLRNYSYITTRQLRMELRILPLGYNESIVIGVTLELP